MHFICDTIFLTPTAMWATVLMLCFSIQSARAGDWPQILGPNRTGIADPDEQLAGTWPATGPQEVWRRPVGSGYAGISVVGGKAFLFHRIDDQEITEALDAATGEVIWKANHPTRFRPQVGGGDGPLCTPTIANGKVITIGAQGMLTCLNAQTGTILWQHRTHEAFDAGEGYFGSGSSPLVIDNYVVVNIGGRKGAGVVGFDLITGNVVWETTDEPASYAAPSSVMLDEKQYAIVVTRYQCLFIDPTNGTIGWSFPFGMRGPTVNAATPLTWKAPDGGYRLFVTASYGIGSVCAAFTKPEVTPQWAGTDSLASQYCTPILRENHLYCIDGRDDGPPGAMTCIDALTGKTVWREENFGYGNLLAADNKVLAVKTNGDVALLDISPQGMTVLGQSQPLPGTIRALPALAQGCLFLRNEDTLVCLDISR
jgi:outer membrane protein assembly factor BamB